MSAAVLETDDTEVLGEPGVLTSGDADSVWPDLVRVVDDLDGDGLADLIGTSGGTETALFSGPATLPIVESDGRTVAEGAGLYADSDTRASDIDADGLVDVWLNLPAIGWPVEFNPAFVAVAGPVGQAGWKELSRFEPSLGVWVFGERTTDSDIDGDGIVDVMIGWSEGDDLGEQVAVWTGPYAGSLDPTQAVLTITDPDSIPRGEYTDADAAAVGAEFGKYQTVLDHDADGVQDLVLGVSDTPHLVLVSGDRTGVVTTADADLKLADAAGLHLNLEVASLGDVDGDGFDELSVQKAGEEGHGAMFFGPLVENLLDARYVQLVTSDSELAYGAVADADSDEGVFLISFVDRLRTSDLDTCEGGGYAAGLVDLIDGGTIDIADKRLLTFHSECWDNAGDWKFRMGLRDLDGVGGPDLYVPGYAFLDVTWQAALVWP